MFHTFLTLALEECLHPPTALHL